MVDSIWTQIMRQRAKRWHKAEAWHGVVCPKMEARLVKAYNKGRSRIVSQLNDEAYEVHYFPLVMVDVGRRTCSCLWWQIKGFLCSHAIVAIRNNGKNLYNLVDSYYHMTKYRYSQSHNIIPISIVEKPPFNVDDFVIQPPIVKRPPGRPKKK
ncbi:hypothetical protein ACSBR2_042813 [Camellia fascicularis]